MKLSKISLCYYPTTVVMVDDNKEYLETAELIISKYIPVHFYNIPQQALNYFQEKYETHSFIDRCIVNNDDDYSDHLMQDIDIRSIHKEIYNPKRFHEITVVVVDYAMPDINGLEFCRLLRQKHPYIKIIMLTGEADKSLAVEAFNDGIIDKFIMKSTPDLFNVLIASIKDLQKKYFIHLSELCFRNNNQFKTVLNSLSDPAFIEIFEQICRANNIAEYYLMDNQGSFLLLNTKGEPSWFAVKTEEEMKQFYQYALIEKAPKNVLNTLKNKTSVLYFHTDEDLKTPPVHWEKYLHPSQRLVGNETYYYAYISDPTAYSVRNKEILSYQQYLDNLD